MNVSRAVLAPIKRKGDDREQSILGAASNAGGKMKTRVKTEVSIEIAWRMVVRKQRDVANADWVERDDKTTCPIEQTSQESPDLSRRRNRNMSSARVCNRGWDLNQEAFDALLRLFEPDREKAGERYTLMRRKLIKMFECRGCHIPIEMADETLNRAARKVYEGEAIPKAKLVSYIYGIARNILKEYWVSTELKIVPLESLKESDHPSEDVTLKAIIDAESRGLELRLQCLEQCMQRLSAENRELLIRYYSGEKQLKIKGRKRLATELGMTANALKIRIHRMRESLAHSISNYIEQASKR